MKGMQIHKYAAIMEWELNQFADIALRKKGTQLADIDLIYVQPFRFMKDMLLEMEELGNISSEGKAAIAHLINKTKQEEGKILQQIDEKSCEEVLHDLSKLIQMEQRKENQQSILFSFT